MEVILRVARLRMPFRISGDGDLEVIAGFGTDKFDQLISVTKLARLGHARRQVAAQGDDATNAGFAILAENVADVAMRRADA